MISPDRSSDQSRPEREVSSLNSNDSQTTQADGREISVDEMMTLTQVRVLAGGVGGNAAAHLLLTVLIVAVQYLYGERLIALGWGLASLTVAALRYLLARPGTRDDLQPDKAARWLRIYLAGIALSGLVWGAAGFLFYPADGVIQQVAIIVAIGAVLAAATPHLAVLKSAPLWFLAPLLIPTAIRLAMLGSELEWVCLAALAALAVSVWFAASGTRKSSQAALELGLKNERLVSHLSEAKAQAEKLNRDLIEEVDRRRDTEDQLKAATKAAEAANLAKGEFLATMSHEIRTPLNGILPLLDILRTTDLDLQQRDYLDTAYESSRHLLSIIDDILDYSKIEAGKLELEQVGLNIKEVLHQVTELMSGGAEQKGLRLRYTIDPNVRLSMRGDPVRIRQVLTNLVSNAIKFTERGQVLIRVSRRRATRTHVELLFSVKDTGIGMDKAAQERLFKAFGQADASTTRNYGGTGLGLVICKRIVELMGGRIGVKSESGKGSVFWFTAPLLKSAGDTAPARSTLYGARLLVISSGGNDAEKLNQSLEALGLAHLTAASVVDGINKLEAALKLGEGWEYDGVLVEVHGNAPMANSLIKQLKEHPDVAHLPVIGFGNPEADRRVSLSREGVGKIISTPVSQRSVELALSEVLLTDETQLEPREPATEELGGNDLEAPPMAGAPPRLEGRVLLVEDNAVNQRVAQKLLVLLGLDVVLAQDGRRAVERIRNERFDLVLMDCQMPVLDGYKATGAIRKLESDEARQRTPIIAMTANAMAGDRQKCLDAGMDDYMSKPLKRELLASTLARWLNQDSPRPAAASTSTTDGDSGSGGSDDGAPVISRETIEDLIDVMGADFGELLDAYLAESPKLIRRMQAAAQAKDAQAMVTPAHSLKSSSANVGALRLSEIAKEIEHSARRGELDGTLKLVAGAAQEYVRARRELERIKSMGAAV